MLTVGGRQRKPITHPKYEHHFGNLEHLRGSLHESDAVTMMENKHTMLTSRRSCYTTWDGPLAVEIYR